ncbi:MAG: SDR family oxidoreductase [Myxococcota bacterium]
MMMRDGALQGRVILVTGGGTGLGKAMSTRLSELGAKVVIAARDLDRLDRAAAEIAEKTGNKPLALQLDVRSPEACQAVVDATVDRLGPIDGLVNNAAGNFLVAAEDLSPGGFDAVVGIVMKGSFLMTQAVGRSMIEKKHPGAILSILTTYAWTGSAFVLPSAMAKAGVLAMTRSLAVEWGTAYGIRLNAIAPGPFPTEGAWKALVPDQAAEEEFKKHNPLHRFGDPGELADLAAFLLSPYSGYINGDCITIDGGQWLKGAGEFNALSDHDRSQVRQMLQAMRGR